MSSAAMIGVLLLAACGQSADTTDDTPPPTDTSTATATVTESDEAESDASESEVAAPGDDADAHDPGDFSDTEEVDSDLYTAQGSGSRAGTSFTTEDGSVACHITGVAAACVVTEIQVPWDESGHANDGLAGTGAPLNTVGWNPNLDAEFGKEPRTWTQQGEFPIRDGAPLDNGSNISVLVNSQTTVRCAVRDNTVTCTDGSGSFTVSSRDLILRD